MKSSLVCIFLFFQLHKPSAQGTLILTGGSFTKDAIQAFVKNAGGDNANFVFIPSASSGIKLPSGFIWEPADTTKEKLAVFETNLALLFGVKKMKVLHTTSRDTADSKNFCSHIDKASGVWLGPGNAGRYANFFLDTRFLKSLESLLERNGVIGGNSAGSIIQGSYILRGRPDKPVLMASGSEKGFGFLKDVVINPHLFSAKRETELINVLDRYPHLLGIGLDDETTVIITGEVMEIKGTKATYIYDNQLHNKKWWYELPPGTKFNLARKTIVN